MKAILLSNTIFLVYFVAEKPEVGHDSKKHKKQVCTCRGVVSISIDLKLVSIKHVLHAQHTVHRTGNL